MCDRLSCENDQKLKVLFNSNVVKLTHATNNQKTFQGLNELLTVLKGEISGLEGNRQ